MSARPPSRLAYIDWLRGLACLLMFQTHCYDAWLGGATRNSKFFMGSQLGGTFPAPLFLFLAGISFAIVTDKLLRKQMSPVDVAKATIRRGAEIFAFGLLFRLQEFAISWGWAPWTDLFRVDILNTIGVSMMLMGLICLLMLSIAKSTDKWTKLITGAVFTSAAIALLTPMLWTNWRPRFLPWELETYVNGVHTLGTPQAWLFPIFPWTAFAFAGLAFGFLLLSNFAAQVGARWFVLSGVAGLVLIYASKFFDSRKFELYPVYDYWHTSPNFFLVRVGMLLLLVVLSYAWCRWGWGQWRFSPLIQLGKTSLLVYWVHIELVYGRFSILPHRSQNVVGATGGLVAIFFAMLVLSIVRTNLKGHEWSLWPRKTAQTAEPA